MADAEHATDDARTTRPRRILKSLPPPPGSPGPRYETGQLLGRGGMGEVLSCEDRRVGRTVAMKVLSRGIGDIRTIERFVDEARLQGRLEHPAIVPVYDIGTSDDGTPFFTMKCVRGVTLAKVLEDRRIGVGTDEWSTRRLLTAFVTVCLAVEYAHRCGVVHGDLKPENVMLGRFGEVHVLDWGCASRALAAAASDRRSESLSATTDVGVLLGLLERGVIGDVVGTPGYLAPEQARGMNGDRRSDIYGLGAILFEIMVGERLHLAPTALSRLVATLERPEHRPSERAPDLAIAPEIDELVVSALAADAERRPNARDLAAGIERYLDGELARTAALRSAEKHAREAGELAELALTGGSETDRSAALREAGRALALDPGNVDACEVLTRLFRAPPTALPAEVRSDCDTSEHGLAANAVRAMSVRALVWAGTIVPALALGVRSWLGTLAAIVVVVACAITFARMTRKRPLTPRTQQWMIGLSMVAVASFSGLFGPLVFAPVFASTSATIFAIGFGPSTRRWACLGAVAAIAVPLLLELTGLVPPSMEFVNGTIVLLPRFVDFAPGPSALFLTAGALMAIPMSVMIGARLRDAVDVRLAALSLKEWQLRRALPSALGERLSAALHQA